MNAAAGGAGGNIAGHSGPVGNTTRRESAGKVFRERRNRSSGNVSVPFAPVEEKTIHGAASNRNNSMYVLPPRKKIKKGKDVPKTKGKLAKLETKSERTLRESIRNLVLLSRVKYHEEQALREMQEQKLRKIIRHLINEGDDSSKVNYSSTGETAAASFMKKISVTFDEYSSLVSTQAQRNEFKKIYLTGIKSYLDALDQQYYILNPEEKAGGMQQPAPAGPVAPVDQQTPPPPAKRSDKLQEAAPAPINTTKINPLSGIDNKNMVAQATAAAVQIAGASNKTGHGAAESALNRDLPQIDPLYNNLTFEQFTVTDSKGGSRSTSDRNDFRIMLIGNTATNEIGNIANEFAKIDIAKQTNDSPHKNNPSNVPALEPKPLPGNDQSTPAQPSVGQPPSGGESPEIGAGEEPELPEV